MKRYRKLGLLVVFFVIVLAALLQATSASSFCKSCHEMDSDYRTWQSSNHASVTCVSCHIGPGTVNFVVHKFNALKEVAWHFAGSYEVPINKGSTVSKQMPSRNCRGCHTNPGKESSRQLVFDHENHADAVATCAYCHNRVSHAGLAAYIDRMKMASCIDCHKQKKAPVSCNTCHPSTAKITPVSHDQGNWRTIHGRGELSSCRMCHDKQRFCDACHGLPMPHPAGWIETHEDTANSRCSACHARSFCDNCHARSD